ncbi:hypothetical protein EI546_13470 [Aequorivita sp. H23M31]|uniref:Type I restriction modification DNA specificity domain-containing protein n=1 Tax=Aequorivita ciconiae TaxID=2494375 RepID=A0A410G5T8_9FLAO|nr:restriction endonuclease subunit S [Aequorivita sp. H23M31]QAA82664.1 hypothetical protein EI546_13470 [Aequorivita sp. H23M31]
MKSGKSSLIMVEDNKNQEIKKIKPYQGSDKGKEDWVECLLGDISSKITKGSTPTTYGYKYQNEGINFIKIENVVKGRIELKSIHQFISEEAHNSQKRSQLKEGDVLFSIAGTIGETCLISKDVLPANTNQAFAIINGFNKVLVADFLRKQLDSFVSRKLKAKARGGAMNNVSLTDLKELNVVIPPLVEQKAIVKKIEELFSSLDSGIADLKKAQEQLVIYRQAVLKKAFEGHPEIPFEKIIESSQNGIAKRKGTDGREIKVLRLADITNLEIDNSSSRSIILKDNELVKYKLNEGDLIVIRVNGSVDLVGRFIHVSHKDEIELWAFCDHFIRFSLDLNKCMSKFYYYFFQLSKVRKFINHNMVSSAGQNTVSQGTIKSISVPLISIQEQHQIVQEIESRLSVCDKVEESIVDSLAKAEALRQSILKKAFEGKLLTEAEIAQCKADKDYEPASVLLARIERSRNERIKKGKE